MPGMLGTLGIVGIGLLAAVELGTGFGGGEAVVAAGRPNLIEVELSVEVPAADGPVVVHLMLPGEDERTEALALRPGDRWSADLELRRANWTVVFEAVGSGRLSEPVTLADLGADPAILAPFGSVTTSTGAEEEVRESGAGWLALAVGAAGLAVLVYLASDGVGRRHPD